MKLADALEMVARTDPGRVRSHNEDALFADAGLGIAAAAQQAGLDFVPLAHESYYLVCLKSALDQPGVAQLRQLLQTPQWEGALSHIAGYQTHQSGQVLSMRRLLPWWDYRHQKPVNAPQ